MWLILNLEEAFKKAYIIFLLLCNMRKRWGYFLGMAGLGVGLIALVSSRHLNHRKGSYQHLLRGAAEYLREYSGENPGEAIEDALRILEIAGKSETGNNGVTAVGQECSRVRDNIGGSVFYSTYNPAFISLAERIEALV